VYLQGEVWLRGSVSYGGLVKCTHGTLTRGRGNKIVGEKKGEAKGEKVVIVCSGGEKKGYRAMERKASRRGL